MARNFVWASSHSKTDAGVRNVTAVRIARTVGEARSWSDVTILGIRIVLYYAPKEIVCPTHGRIQEAISWAAVQSRVSYRLEYRICAFGQIMTQKAAAAILQMPSSTVSDILHRVITRTRTGHRIRGLITLGVDEISYLKGRTFATIVYDLDRSRVVWVGQGKAAPPSTGSLTSS